MVRQKNKKSRNQMPSIQPVTEKNEFKTLEPGKEHHTLKLKMFFSQDSFQYMIGVFFFMQVFQEGLVSWSSKVFPRHKTGWNVTGSVKSF